MRKYIIGASLCLLMTSCLNNDFLEVYPKDQQTEATAFKSYENFKTYSWGLYNVFFGYASGTEQSEEIFRGDFEADNMIRHIAGSESKWAYQKAKIEATNNNWDYDYIRRVNIMIDNIDHSSLSQADKDHWRSVGYFFRSYKYFKMLSLFGDIPWVEHVLQDDSPELYGKRDSRDLVAANILANLKYAEEHIKKAGDGKNTINATVVQALISRFALFEGTWRRYHGLADADQYLAECVRASAEVLKLHPNVHGKYEEVFNSETLDGMTGIILYKAYATSQLCHGLTRMMRTGESFFEATKDVVDSYLCVDGRPISTTTSRYGGDKEVYAQFRDRDYRLYNTVCPPYMVKLAAASTTNWEYTTQPADREYMDLMNKISGATYHNLPTSNFKNFVTQGQPHFKNVNWGQGWNCSQMGFWVWKYYNTHTDASTAGGVCTTDAPLFRVGEVMLNYAEALCELNRFDQAAADITINKLRIRANVAAMKVADITDDFDAMRDQTIPALLWEVRRERRVELMGEGFRLDDLRRWKKGTYVNKQPRGVYLKNASAFKVKVMDGPSANEGYVYFFEEPLGWLDKYYLNPLPLNQLTLNPELTQQPEWLAGK